MAADHRAETATQGLEVSLHNTKGHNPQPLQPILSNLFSAFGTSYNRGPLSTDWIVFSLIKWENFAGQSHLGKIAMKMLSRCHYVTKRTPVILSFFFSPLKLFTEGLFTHIFQYFPPSAQCCIILYAHCLTLIYLEKHLSL